MQNAFWQQRYGEQGYAYGESPNVYLTCFASQFKSGQRVLVVGDGEGRNGVWLAQQGLQVLSVDQSTVGLQKAEQLASQRNVSIETRCTDLTQWQWPENEFDYVVIIYVHFAPLVRQQMHQAALQALKPGGELILEAFTFAQLSNNSGGPPTREMLYDAGMLKADFSSGEILELEECRDVLAEGKYHAGDADMVRAHVRRVAG